MKRNRSAFRSGQAVNTPEGEQGFWPSYADMMSSVALILFFLMLISYIQNLITGNQLVSTQDLLKDTEKSLAATMLQIDDAKAELGALALELEDAELAILAQQLKIDDADKLIADQAATLLTQQTLIDEQKAYIALTTEELERLRTQMQNLAYLRLSVLDRIKDSIATTLGDPNKVSIGDNGNIILNEGLFFDFNSAAIKKESYPLLNELASAFSTFLADKENAQYVDSIVISGHTDNRGTAERNRELSSERANAVLNYLFTAKNNVLEPYMQYFCAAGYGMTRPVASNDTAAGRDANRRIEVSIILKDESVLDIVDAYLAQEMPDLTLPTLTPSITERPTATPKP